MGLDITAYRKATLIQPVSFADMKASGWEHPAYNEGEHNFLFADAFELQADKMPDGIYLLEDPVSWRAGSYSGYSTYRRELAKMAGLPAPEVVWDNPEAYAHQPFFRQVNFSDCEGFMGPLTCSILLQDYESHLDKATAATTLADPWFVDRYHAWMKGLKIAAGSGVIRFH